MLVTQSTEHGASCLPDVGVLLYGSLYLYDASKREVFSLWSIFMS